MSTALALAQTIAQKSPSAVRTIRESFLTVEGLGMREGFRFEQNYITPLSKSPEALEARQAFIEKRKAVF
jgi:enoyl-CoA hydratase/carnithine racemase